MSLCLMTDKYCPSFFSEMFPMKGVLSKVNKTSNMKSDFSLICLLYV